jgi:hypothetical protein
MTSQESQALQDFLNQLTQVKGIAKDPQADDLIARAVAQQPDAAYLLVQRAMLLEQALSNAKVQISQLQSELQATRASNTTSSTSFLDGGGAWGRSATDIPRPAMPTAMPAQSPVSTQSPLPNARPGFLGGGGGSFLGNIAATAAGVAGGAFLFQGIENLMGHHNRGSGLLDQSDKSGLPAESAADNSHYAVDNVASDRTQDDDLGNLDNLDIGDSGDDGLSSI